jgi:serine/threonine protein kinase
MRLGRYLLEEHLGDGATSTVFRSFHEMLNIPVAIKIFDRIDASGEPDAAQRFLTEAQTLVRLQHPNIVRVLDVDIYEQFPHIVMEYVGEMTLASQIHNMGQLPAQRIAQIGIAVAEALQAASRLGLLHRDVKPSNILERKDGHIKLVDFGIATRRSKEGTIADPLAARGFISGTPSYIAPEQAQSPATIDARADMYGLGATLYHAAAGRPPFVRQTIEETLNAHIHDEPVHITQLVPGFSAHLAWAIHRLLRKTPEERFATWGDVKDALANALSGGQGDEPELSIHQGAEEAQDTATEDLPAPVASEPAPHGPPDVSAIDTLVPTPSSASLRISAASVPQPLALSPTVAAPPVAAPPVAAAAAVLRARVLTPVEQRWQKMPPRLRIATSIGLCMLVTVLMLLVLTC